MTPLEALEAAKEALAPRHALQVHLSAAIRQCRQREKHVARLVDAARALLAALDESPLAFGHVIQKTARDLEYELKPFTPATAGE